MPSALTAVFTAGIHHGLEYGYCFFKRLQERARERRLNVVLTDGSPYANDDAIRALDPAIFYGLGHGECCVFTVECMQVYISVPYTCPSGYRCFDTLRLDMMAGRHVHLLSCLTGLHLGSVLVGAGAISYIGYKDYFIYGVKASEAVPDPEPCSPPTSQADYYTFIDSDIEGERKIILEGTTVREAINAMKAKFQEYIDKYTNGEWKDYEIAPWAATLLQHDLNVLVSYGTIDWSPLLLIGPPTLTSQLTVASLAFAIMFGLVWVMTPLPPAQVKPPPVKT